MKALFFFPLMLLAACSSGPGPKYKSGDVVYSCVGHLKGQVIGQASYIDGYVYWVRFMTISMEEKTYIEAELCGTPTSAT